MSTSPADIRVLPDVVANQIAAGEVVERPAAVVKELAENSLDARSTRITVRIADGGRRLIEIEDDGHGIHSDQLPTALLRHATSKLSVADDLFRIGTLGFRGEALPSIASVSEFTIASQIAALAHGRSLSSVGGHTVADSPCAMPTGTRVTVRNLFWNVPARLKFLKAEASETGHVTDQVIRLALSHPAVAFRLEADERTVLDLPAGETLLTRIRSIFGKNFADGLLSIAQGKDSMELTGFVAHPREAKPTSKRQYLFLNGRFVRDKLLVAAVRDGHKGFLEPRLHGAVFLHLDIDPAQVDVNVHPTKSEVRFRREGEIFALVSSSINKVLAANSGDFSLLTDADRATAIAALPPRQAAAQPWSRTVVKPAAPAAPAIQERFLPMSAPVVEKTSSIVESAPTATAISVRVAEPASLYRAEATPAPVAAATPIASPQRSMPRIRRIVQLHRMFLLIETDDGIRLVDQHALHEKALFLCLDPQRLRIDGQGVQQLAVPRIAEMSAAEVATVTPLLPSLIEFGITAEVFGPTSIAVRALPAALRRTDWTAFFAKLASSGSGDSAVASLVERIAHAAACHGAVKAGQELSPDEQHELVRLLYELDHMEHCPHGRPTTLDLSWSELSRRFQR